MRVGKKRVERLMREGGLRARQKRRFRRTTDSRHGLPTAPNVLARSFEPAAPNRAWVTDVTDVATDEGRAYLAVMLDLYARRVVGWALGGSNDTSLALAALGRALASRRPPRGWVHHAGPRQPPTPATPTAKPSSPRAPWQEPAGRWLG